MSRRGYVVEVAREVVLLQWGKEGGEEEEGEEEEEEEEVNERRSCLG